MLDAIGDYLVAIKQEGKSKGTVRQYRWHLEKMRLWLLDCGITSAGDVGRRELRRWGAEIRETWAPATVKQAVSAVRSFFRWMAAEEGWAADPGRALVVPRVPIRLQRTITAEEVGRLLGAADRETVAGLRMGAMVALLVDSGIRAAELCGLDRSDVDLGRWVARVVGKGGGEREAFFGIETAHRLQLWMDARPTVGGDAVFVSLGGATPGSRLTTRGLRMILRRFGQGLGIDGVSPHAFRRAFACISTEAGAPSRVVMGAGGWSNISMVERYTRGLEAERQYRKYSPVDYVARRK